MYIVDYEAFISKDKRHIISELCIAHNGDIIFHDQLNVLRDDNVDPNMKENKWLCENYHKLDIFDGKNIEASEILQNFIPNNANIFTRGEQKLATLQQLHPTANFYLLPFKFMARNACHLHNDETYNCALNKVLSALR